MARCKSIEYTIPAADSAQDGKMNWMILSQYLYAGYVNIRSRDLPQCVFESSYMQGADITPIKINYCFRGRCEVMLNKGATTFVVGDEIAVDYGTSCEGRKAFFYPTSEYKGVELIVIPAKPLEKELSPYGGKELISGLTDKFSDRSIPFITVSNARIRRCMEDFRDDIISGADEKLILKGEDSLGEIAEQVGYQSQSRFSKAFFKYHKVLPMEYMRRNYSAML